MVAISKLREVLRYDPQTGKLFWLTRPASLFTPKKQSQEAAANAWNAKWAGSEAFTAEVDGYRCGRVFGRFYRAHQIAWALSHNEWPHEIDHISGVRNDNRLANLRSVSHAENCRNLARNRTNMSGATGVYWDPSRNKWVAKIAHKFIGRFEAFGDAVNARKTAEDNMNFHRNHGRAA